MANFSNRAGQTASYYLLAPGVRVVSAGPDDNILLPGNPTNDADTDGDYYAVSGTSFSAPLVAGALALMLDLFPNMTPEDALSALLVSATDYVTTTPDFVSGVTAGVGTDQVGGRGILNLQRAFAPIGTTSFTFDGVQVEVAQALGPASGALGDWASNSGAFNGVVFQDMFKRGFRIDHTQMTPGRAGFGDFGDGHAGEEMHLHGLAQGFVERSHLFDRGIERRSHPWMTVLARHAEFSAQVVGTDADQVDAWHGQDLRQIGDADR
mgnify:CR=1 FL=1